MTTVVTIAHNESYILPFFVNHYREFADRIVIYDNQSTDNTAKIAKRLGCEVVDYQSEGCDRRGQTALQNTFVKQFKEANWLVVVDTDEFLYHSDIKQLLSTAYVNNYSAFRTEGFEVISEAKPVNGVPIYKQITARVKAVAYSKMAIFAPKLINETNYGRGRHFWQPTGIVKYYPEPLKLLHCKWVGGLDRVLKKHSEYMNRITLPTSVNGLYEDQNTRAYYEYLRKASTKLL